MARTDTLGNFLTDVADAIRDKKGNTDPISASEFDTEIASIEGGGGDVSEYFTDTAGSSESYARFITRITKVFPIDMKFYKHYNGANSLSYCFSGMYNLVDISEIKKWDLTNIVSIDHMFNSCKSLEDIDFTGLNTPVLNDMSYLFNGCEKLKSVTFNIDTSKVTKANNMFTGCKALNSVDLSTFDTGSLTDISYMFQGCTNTTFENINLNNLNVSNVTKAGWIFSSCNGVINLDLSSWTLPKVTDLSASFYGCNAKKIDLSNATGENVTQTNMMFFNAMRVNEIYLDNFDFSKVTSFSGMFTSCGSNAKRSEGAYADGMPYVYVKDATAQNWVLTADNGHKSDWTTANVIIAGSEQDLRN